MIRSVLDAFVEEDVAKAQRVLHVEQSVDDLNVQVFDELLTFMLSDPRTCHLS
jgi:phosphate uptake regulator